MRLRSLIDVATATFAVVTAACSGCPQPFEVTERVLLVPGQPLELTVPDGELRVTGRERARTVEIVVRGCDAGGASVERDSAAADARGVRIVAARADVQVLLPSATELRVRHGAGRVELRAVGPTSLVQQRGDVRIEQVIGPLRVVAGPGTLYVREVIGDVDVTDAEGALFVEGVAGRVLLRDGSGGIHLREIAGDVVVASDGGGAIDARGIDGDLDVLEKREDLRMIRYNDVAGRVRLPASRR